LLPGCLIHTTCELVIMEFTDRIFHRKLDPQTKYNELIVKMR
jgi:predicted DNA-binding protein with PD1-like motif